MCPGNIEEKETIIPATTDCWFRSFASFRVTMSEWVERNNLPEILLAIEKMTSLAVHSLEIIDLLHEESELRKRLQSSSPHAKFAVNEVDWDSSAYVNKLINWFLKWAASQRLQQSLHSWKELFVKLQLVCHQGTTSQKAAVFSLLIQMPRRLFHQFVDIVCGMVPRPALHTVSPLTEAFLKCDAVKAAQMTALGPLREQYAQHGAFPDIPQIIIVEGVRPPMHAFLCLGNVVAINSRYWDDIEDSCDVMRMCNLIMRVQQHGFYWASFQDYPIGAPEKDPAECVAGREKVAVQEAGERVERALWGGHLLKWWDPLSREETREHCNKLCVALRETGQLPQLSSGYVAELADSVRCATPQCFQAEDATTCVYVEEDEAWR
jgi:hypothetical protein